MPPVATYPAVEALGRMDDRNSLFAASLSNVIRDIRGEHHELAHVTIITIHHFRGSICIPGGEAKDWQLLVEPELLLLLHLRFPSSLCQSR